MCQAVCKKSSSQSANGSRTISKIRNTEAGIQAITSIITNYNQQFPVQFLKNKPDLPVLGGGEATQITRTDPAMEEPLEKGQFKFLEPPGGSIRKTAEAEADVVALGVPVQASCSMKCHLQAYLPR